MKLLVAALGAAILGTALAPVTASADEEPTRVMLLGDSVTQGKDGDYTWRYFAWRGLQQTGAAVDFVGPNTGTHTADIPFGGDYADPAFDIDHASRWGMAMWEMLNRPSATAPRMRDLVAGQGPDVIVETLGVNDLAWGQFGEVYVADEVRALVAEARAVKPDVDFVLGGLGQTWLRDVKDYNALLPTLAEELSTPESRVVVAPAPDLTEGVDTYDAAHPTTEGQVKIAASVSAGLEALGIGRTITMPLPSADPEPTGPEPTEPAPTEPTAPVVEVIAPPASVEVPPPGQMPAVTPTPVASQPVAPSRPRRAKAVRKGAKVVITWHKVGAADAYVVKCGPRKVSKTGSRATLRTPSRACLLRATSAAGVSPWVRVAVRQRR